MPTCSFSGWYSFRPVRMACRTCTEYPHIQVHTRLSLAPLGCACAVCSCTYAVAVSLSLSLSHHRRGRVDVSVGVVCLPLPGREGHEGRHHPHVRTPRPLQHPRQNDSHNGR